jgi:protoporphyrin/coproporphyrin ferrochelatase
MNRPEDHPVVPPRRIGVLIVNLGTPDAPEPGAVKLYLKEFLSDPRVVEIPQLVWQPILRGIILNTRPRKSAHAYRQVWTDKGSPLAAITARQADALTHAFDANVVVDHAMRYGKPAISERLDALKQIGCERILIAPLYPQYCAATTATANDEAFAHLRRMRWQPAIRTLPPYHDDPVYISALKSVIQIELARLDFEPEAIVASFHGMPQRTLELGDPYHCHCRKTARMLSDSLGRELITAFQSRFGRAKWLEPATDKVLSELPARGVRKVAVTAPGFSADCLETLEELAIRGRDTFLEAGGTHFAYLPCLNDSEAGLAMLRFLIGRELEGWLRPQQGLSYPFGNAGTEPISAQGEERGGSDADAS